MGSPRVRREEADERLDISTFEVHSAFGGVFPHLHGRSGGLIVIFIVRSSYTSTFSPFPLHFLLPTGPNGS